MAKDIYEVLKKEHDEARAILGKLASSSESDAKERQAKGHAVALELITHNEAESAVLYRRLREFDDLKDMVRDEQLEHEQTNADLRELMTLDPGSEVWLDKLIAIKHALEHHIESEEGELFPRAKKLLDDSEAERMAEQFQHEQDQRKEQLKAA